MLDDLSALTDRELLRRHVDGDGGAAFGELFRRHRDRMWAVALRTTRNRELAADAVQDAFISAFRRADSFRGEAAVTTWLHRIVVNACLDRLRREKPTVRRAGDLGELDLPDRHDHHASVEMRLDVREALARLPEGQRMALVLVDMHGLPRRRGGARCSASPRARQVAVLPRVGRRWPMLLGRERRRPGGRGARCRPGGRSPAPKEPSASPMTSHPSARPLRPAPQPADTARGARTVITPRASPTGDTAPSSTTRPGCVRCWRACPSPGRCPTTSSRGSAPASRPSAARRGIDQLRGLDRDPVARPAGARRRRTDAGAQVVPLRRRLGLRHLAVVGRRASACCGLGGFLVKSAARWRDGRVRHDAGSADSARGRRDSAPPRRSRRPWWRPRPGPARSSSSCQGSTTPPTGSTSPARELDDGTLDPIADLTAESPVAGPDRHADRRSRVLPPRSASRPMPASSSTSPRSTAPPRRSWSSHSDAGAPPGRSTAPAPPATPASSVAPCPDCTPRRRPSS